MSQKDVFLQSEGDAWFRRNIDKLSKKLPEDDSLYAEILSIQNILTERLKILEIGCGDGTRLAWLKDNLSADCYGIELSAKAVEAACKKGIDVKQGTADSLPFKDEYFDIVIFGFCLYLCDRQDLFRIACSADRVLRRPGWLMILDFFSPEPQANAYKHDPMIKSYKMDYRKLFDWHPDYACLTHNVRHHSKLEYTDEQNEWVAISILRKYQRK